MQPPASAMAGKAERSAELLALGAIYLYPQLPVCPWLAIAQGQKYWELAVAHLSEEDIALAVQAARKL